MGAQRHLHLKSTPQNETILCLVYNTTKYKKYPSGFSQMFIPAYKQRTFYGKEKVAGQESDTTPEAGRGRGTGRWTDWSERGGTRLGRGRPCYQTDLLGESGRQRRRVFVQSVTRDGRDGGGVPLLRSCGATDGTRQAGELSGRRQQGSTLDRAGDTCTDQHSCTASYMGANIDPL